MLGDRQKLYDDAKAFFEFDGNAAMKLSRRAAIDVCRGAAGKGIIVIRVEGGISSNNKFEARLDAIWDGRDPPINRHEAEKNNVRAAAFINSADSAYNAFVVTSAPIGGYAHGAPAGAKREVAEKG